jgi:hypothetical protein
MDTLQSRSERLAAISSPFSNLPLELILHITSFLPLESVGSLSLSCHSLYSYLKTKFLKLLKEAEFTVMNAFLQLLERDLPLHIVCPHCNKLHFTPLAERHLVTERFCHEASKTWSACRVVDSLSQGRGRMTPRFTSTIFLMAMKAHRQGKDTTALLRLLSHKKIDDSPGAFAELHTSEARICNGSLLVRDQKVFMLPASQTIPLCGSGEFGFCRHTRLSRMSDLLWCGINVPTTDEIDGYENKEGIIYCRYCYTEMRIDFKGYGRKGNAMFVTRWMDVGEGRDARDMKWRVRLTRNNDWLWDDVAYPRGSICAAFEQGKEFKFDSLLTKQDEMELRAKCPTIGLDELKALDGDEEPHFIVKDGRLDSVPSKSTGHCCHHHHDRYI